MSRDKIEKIIKTNSFFFVDIFKFLLKCNITTRGKKIIPFVLVSIINIVKIYNGLMDLILSLK